MSYFISVFFSNDTATTDIYTLSLHDALPISILIDATLVGAVLLPATMKLLGKANWYLPKPLQWLPRFEHEPEVAPTDRKSTRLNSSHANISYAVFCLKKQ